MMPTRGFLAAAWLVGFLAVAVAQSTPSPTAKPDTPATPQSAGQSKDQSDMGPGKEGATGWSGGTGGSNIGTSPHAATPGSKTEQPETAKGVNPQPTTGQSK